MSDSGAGGAPKPSTDGFNRSQFAKDEEENPLPVTYPVKKESGLDKIKTIFSSNEKEEGAIQEINVVLVGNMGVGKSTLGNYLFNLGDKTNVLFQTSDDPTTASTKEAQTKSFGIEFCGQKAQVNVMDTPGLSEQNPEEDLKHMIGLFKETLKMKDIHVVILVVGIQNRFDRATVHTIQYYKALFHPVFMHGDVFLALPNFGQRRLEEIIEEADEETEIEASIASYLDVYKKECERKLDGVRIASCGFFESVTTKISRRREINFFQKGMKSLSVDRLSLRSRNEFFIKMLQSRPISMIGHTFPLPPVIESIRLRRLNKVESLLKEVEDKIALQYDIHHSKLEALSASSKDIVGKLLEASKLKDEILALEVRGKSGYIYLDGDDYFCFKEAGVFPVWAEIKPYEVEHQSWNCSCEEISREEQNGRFLVHVRITPDSLNLLAKKSEPGKAKKMWFSKVWAEWDGKIANKEKLDMKTTELLRYEREADAQQRALEREQEELYGVSSEARDFQEQQRTLQDELRLVSKERYRLDDAAHAVKIFASEAGHEFDRRKGINTLESSSSP